ncbi:cell envelope biogenesis protein OmpA [Sphingopyxis lindanitolerans]|uniref:Cell envelope biogenesis protein OmpA n=1 Tax=Sphingopyxis lindanitolerans TaxID=2054227 RepID=A0A2S8B777_9SPHN|nr:OmpA family protein [Sphingopyxis lindanitolerans]PQM28261.1 cell envelope biogenesis protein OmpA [Sphingopyxis lindanitolerans]
MTHPLPLSLRQLFLIPVLALLAACQSLPPPQGFSPEQIAALQAEGFVETGEDWTLTINERLLFPSNESGLQPDQIERLGTLAHHLIAVGITTARVEGHTDSTGKSAYNQALSEARAQTVAAPLQANGMRFTADQIIGRGETIPLSPNSTPEGRQDNRRVVLIVSPAE